LSAKIDREDWARESTGAASLDRSTDPFRAIFRAIFRINRLAQVVCLSVLSLSSTPRKKTNNDDGRRWCCCCSSASQPARWWLAACS